MIERANYANEDRSAVIIYTDINGAVAISESDRPELWSDFQAWIAAGNTAGEYEPPLAPAPSSISDRQFFQQLAIAGIVTQAEALAAVKTGAIPPALQGFVDAIADPAQKFAANMLLSGATVFERNHPLTEAIGAGQGMTPDQIDAFFNAAVAL